MLADAGTFAVLDVVFQAYFKFSFTNVFGCQGVMASPQRIEFLDEFQQRIHRWNVAIWTIIGGSVADDVSCLEDPWKIFVAYADGRVGLVVLQQYVVPRTIFLDEVIFEQKRIFFGFHDDVSYVCNLAYQDTCLAIRVFPVEIGRDSSLQVFRLSNVDYRPFDIQILVDAGAFGQVQNDAFQIIVGVNLFLFHRSVYKFNKVCTSTFSGKAFLPFNSFNSITKLMNVCLTPHFWTRR